MSPVWELLFLVSSIDSFYNYLPHPPLYIPKSN